MLKQEMIDKILSLKKNIISETEQLLKLSAVNDDTDTDSVRDPEDYSHQDEQREMVRNYESQINTTEFELDLFRKIDFSPKKTVQEGAFVNTNRMKFLIGIATKGFELNGADCIGISTTAPAFKIMEGMKKGDSFSLAEVTYTILDIQ